MDDADDLQPQAAADGDAAQDLEGDATAGWSGREAAGAGRRAVAGDANCSGRRASATQAPEIDGVCLINDVEGAEPRPGQIRRLRVTEAHDYDLVGTLLERR